MALVQTQIYLEDTGLVITDLTFSYCKNYSNRANVDTSGAALYELTNGMYLIELNVTEDAAFRIYQTGDNTKWTAGSFEIRSGDYASQVTLLAAKAVIDAYIDATISSRAAIVDIVDITNYINASVNSIRIPKGEWFQQVYQVLENGEGKDITNYTISFGVKDNIDDTAFKIGPVAGVLVAPTNGQFTITLTDTETNIEPFNGRFALAIYDAAGNKTTLTPPGGQEFDLVEDILDVT